MFCVRACECACVRAYMRVFTCACVRACVCACVRACVHACVYVCLRASACGGGSGDPPSLLQKKIRTTPSTTLTAKSVGIITPRQLDCLTVWTVG